MTPIITYNPYSVVLVPFPFTDKKQSKKRPALVISSVQHQHDTGHVTLLMITTAKKTMWASDYQINDLKAAGLQLPFLSYVRQKVFTIDLALIKKCIGKFSVHDMHEVQKRLKINLAM